ncbi:MAG: hypothetical protein FJ267_05195 [Planctomycetes bacterium]|nr:hypothetical protein [Planctomycetota bacterium]
MNDGKMVLFFMFPSFIFSSFLYSQLAGQNHATPLIVDVTKGTKFTGKSAHPTWFERLVTYGFMSPHD